MAFVWPEDGFGEGRQRHTILFVVGFRARWLTFSLGLVEQFEEMSAVVTICFAWRELSMDGRDLVRLAAHTRRARGGLS